jgi:hypothetical protein
VEFTVENTDTTEPAAEQTWQSRRDLPSGGWVELRDPMDLRKGDKDKALKTLESRNLGGAGVELVNALIRLGVVAWEIPYLPGAALPHRNPKVLDQLTLRDGNAIEAMCNEYRMILFPEMATVDGMGKPGSPTPPASE